MLFSAMEDLLTLRGPLFEAMDAQQREDETVAMKKIHVANESIISIIIIILLLIIMIIMMMMWIWWLFTID